MPKFTVTKFNEGVTETVSPGGNAYQPTLYIPINEDILEILSLDAEVEVKMVGKVVGLESQEERPEGALEFRFSVDNVEVTPKMNEFGELAMDDEDDDE